MPEITLAFFDARPYDKTAFDKENRLYGYQITYFDLKLTKDTAPLARGFSAVCAFVNDNLDQAVLKTLHSYGIQLIALRSAGYNNVDLKTAYGKIHIARVPAYSPYAVAEHAVALMLSLNRKTHRAYYRTRDNNFNISGLTGFDMHGKTAGIIGTGKIGQKLAAILNGFGMQILGYDKFPNRELSRLAAFRYTDLNTLYAQSDIISLHCPLNKETHYLINRESIARMKHGVMLINTGRGGLVDTKALLTALKSGKIGAAGLDVYEEESEYFFEDFSATVISDDILARLLTFPNVLITSHQGFLTHEALSNIAATTLQNIQDFFAGKELVHEICYHCDAETCRRKKSGKCF